MLSRNVYPSSGRGPEGLPSAKPISENYLFPKALEEAPEGLPSAKPIWKKNQINTRFWSISKRCAAKNHAEWRLIHVRSSHGDYFRGQNSFQLRSHYKV